MTTENGTCRLRRLCRIPWESVGGNAHADEEASEGSPRWGERTGRARRAAGAAGTETGVRVRDCQWFTKRRRVTSGEEAETAVACLAQLSLFPEDVRKPPKSEAGE